MSEKEMYKKSFQRPSNFFQLSARRQWEIDEDLGILDWLGNNLSKKEIQKFEDYYM